MRRILGLALVALVAAGTLVACEFPVGTVAQCAGVTSAVAPQPTANGNKISCPTDYPAAFNTGVEYGLHLTPVYPGTDGLIHLTTDNATYNQKLFDGPVRVEADNVTIDNSFINVNQDTSGVLLINSVNLVIKNTDIFADKTQRTTGEAAIGWANYTLDNVNITGFGEAAAANGNVTITNSYLNQDYSCIHLGCHQDGVQVEYGDNVLIKHNTVLMPFDGANSALRSSGEPHNNVVFEDNLLYSYGGKDLEFGGATIKNNKIVASLGRDAGALSPIFQSAPNPNGPVCGTTWYDGALKGQTVAGNPACSGPEPRPSRANTGPRYALTDLSASQFASTGVCNRQRIHGDVRLSERKTYTLTDCEIGGNLFMPSGESDRVLALHEMPVVNMDYVDILNSIQATSAVKWNVNHTFIGNQPQFTMMAAWVQVNGPYPALFKNTMFFQPFATCVPDAYEQCPQAHSEALHVLGFGEGFRFENVNFELEGGPFGFGPGQGGYTGVMNFHAKNAVFDGCWFDFGSQVATYTLGWIDGPGNVVKNSALDTRAGFFSVSEFTTQATFINNRSLQTGLPYNG